MLLSKIKKFKVIYHEEGFSASFSHLLHIIFTKLGIFRDRWIFGRIIELRGNVGRLDGCTFLLDSPLIKTSAKSSFIQGTYERDERKAIRCCLDRSLPVIELGASIGVVSCVTNKILKNPKAHVVVEANPELIPILKKNRDLNKSSFEILNKASGYGSKDMVFYINDKFLSGSAQRVTAKQVSVPTVTLAEICNEYNFEHANLICDIEGGELELVNNEIDLLSKKIYQIILEFHPSLLGEEKVAHIRSTLLNAGFRKIRTGTYSTVSVFQNDNLKRGV